MTQATKVRYRPVLTAIQITKMLELAKLEQPMSDTSYSIISVLAPFQAKIENAGIKPAYETKPPKPGMYTLEGLGGEPEIDLIKPLVNTVKLTKETIWLMSYNKWLETPVECSLNEIAEANEHRYLHNLMSELEAKVFEAGMGINTIDNSLVNESID